MNKKKIFNVATYKRDSYLVKTLKSVQEQADVINVMLNSHNNIPRNTYGLDLSKIKWYLTDNSIGDGYKFYKLEESDGYFFTIDDDIIYPAEYADYMIYKFHKYGGNNIITLHGRSFCNFPTNSYYHGHCYSYPCLGDVKNDYVVHSGGTGVMMFHTNLLKFPYTDIKHANMADVWIAKFAKEKGIKITCVAHRCDYLNYQAEVGNNTIWDEHHTNDTIQTQIINEVYAN